MVSELQKQLFLSIFVRLKGKKIKFLRLEPFVMFSHLQGQRVNLQLLQESSCRQLEKLLDKVEGSKAIILDDALLGPLGLVAPTSLFSERSIKLIKMEKETRMPKDFVNIIYLVRPQLDIMDVIVGQVLKNTEKGRVFHIFFVPRYSGLCTKHLEQKGVYGSFGLFAELPWNFYSLDNDIISMENQLAFRDVAIDGDPTALYQAALGLVQLQRIYGRIPKIYGKGTMAQGVWERAKKLGSEEKILSTGEKGTIDQIILLDRQIDLLSAFATQLTYEGLIDEFYGISHNQLTMPSDLFSKGSHKDASPTHMTSEKKIFILNSGEALYAELRNKNFNEVGKILSRSAKDISAAMNASSQENSVQEMKRLVDKLPALLAQKQSVANHTTIAELIRKHLDSFEFTDDLAAEQEFMMCEDIDKPSAYIEDLMAKKIDLKKVLRLMCVQCAAASGFKEKVLTYYKRELVHVYGIEVLLKISSLEKAGVIYTQSESRAYAVLRKTLNLTVEDVVEVNPKDISYVHSFYAPLTARIVEQSLKPLGWQSLKSQINNLPGPTFEDFQAPLIGIGGRHSSTPSEGSSLNIPRVVLVFFVGGCTFAEIAALRFLAQDEDKNVEFVIATTKIITKHSFLKHLLQ